jgi:lipopolysaccharide biosynthesis regulator YciM
MIILGRIYDKQNNYEDAIKYFEMVSSYEVYALEANFRLGKLYEKMGNNK